MRRWSAGGAVAALLGSMLVWTTAQPAVAAACPIPGGFEIDGDMLDANCTPPADDWATPGLGVASTSQGGTYSTNATTKEDTNPTGWTASGNTPDKADLAQVYAAARVVAGHYYVFVAWEREGTSGTQGYAIEVDNSAANTGPGGVPRPSRLNGGSIYYLQANGGAPPSFVESCQTTPANPYPPHTCSNSASGFTVAINTAPISDPFLGTTIPTSGFFEAAFDVTALTGLQPGCPAPSSASLYLRSITGQLKNGNLKAYSAPLTIQPPSTCVEPGITTTATPGGDLVAPGSAQHDVATLTGTPTPTGSVAFFLCAPNQVTGAGCPTGSGTQIGGAVALTNGSATSSDASGATTTTTGTYCWRAEYTPDANGATTYLPVSHTNASTECFTVVHASPTLTTQIAVTGADAPGLGFTTLGDTATLHDFVGTVTGETVTFNLYGPYAEGVTPTCATTPVFTTTGTLSAGGVATTSQTFTPTAAGTYVWVASYPGNPLNDSATHACNQASEKTAVVGATIDVAKSANPPGPVSAGDPIGFDITVSNTGTVPATGVQVTDTLPAGLTWTLNPAYTGCSITGGVLTCDLGTVAGQTTLPVIHVEAVTAPANCGTVTNQATITTTNGTGGDSDLASVQVICPDLSIAKTADAASVDAGEQIGFTVTVSNAGPGAAKGVTVNDPLPGADGVEWSIESGPANCSVTGTAPNQTLVCTAVDLASGQSLTVHLVSDTAFASCGAFDNLAGASATNDASVQAGATTSVLCPDLDAAKTADSPTVSAGTDIGFTITATNTGDGNANGAVISDPLPAGPGVSWSVQSSTGPLTCAIAAGTLTCTGTLGAGQTQTVHVVSPTTFASCATYDNTATLSSDVVSPITAQASVQVLCAALSVNKTADAASVSAGTPIGFTVIAQNTGAGNATGALISDTLPTGPGITWTVQSSTGPLTCAIAAGTLTCTGTLLAGASHAVHVTSPTQFASCGVYNNTATLSATNAGQAVGSNQASTAVECPALSVVKTPNAGVISAGEPVTFDIVVSNAGPGTATGATLHDPLPAGSGIDWSIGPVYSGPGSCDITGAVGSQVLDCSFGDLAAGASATVHIISSTQFASCGTYDNTATFSATNAGDPVSDAGSTTVNCPSVTVDKTAAADTISAGDSMAFTITLTNGGPGTAFGVVLTDPLPAGDGTLGWSIDSGPANCSINGAVGSQVLTCTAVDLAAGQSLVVQIVSDPVLSGCTAYPNTATVTGTNLPVTTGAVLPTILSPTATVDVLCPALVLGKTADAETVDAGDPVGFTVTLTNGAEAGTARDVLLEDPLPAGPDGSGVVWTISPAYTGQGTCEISGDPGSQVLECDFGDVEAGASTAVHVTTATTFVSCAVYDNTVSLSASNAPSLDDTASSTVQCPALRLAKTADDDQVPSGSSIGFTVTATNDGPGTALNAAIDDPLPAGGAGADVEWAISPAYDGPGTCEITGAVGSQVLACALPALEAGATVSVHVVSATTLGLEADCASYDNQATLSATNAPSLTAADTTTVVCPPLPTPITRTPTPPVPAAEPPLPLATTGAGRLDSAVIWALVLLLAGGGLTLAATRRGPSRSH